MRNVTLAATQMACGKDQTESLERAKKLIRQAAAQGANIILIQELFETPYFCQDQLPGHFELARPVEGNDGIARFQKLARELDVVLPFSFFERDNQAYFNSVAMIDAGGELLGIYRKTHIPDGVGYQEKYYFNPGDTGFRVWDTRFGRIGTGICWDQWYPECARAMALMGAEVLLYPTAIGSEPHDDSLDTAAPWRRAMQGHAVSNVIPVVGANRTGFEPWDGYPGGGQRFYGSSFIANHRGVLVADMARDEEGVALATFDLDFLAGHRAAWGFFRDRRTDLYGALTAPRPA
jgi:N-carbamoylputrescine amidase